MEFLLINHPLDCPVCDKGGECPLQDISYGWGGGKSRYIEPKRHFKKPLELSPLVAIDRERCILCYRCVRFSQEVAEDYQLVFLERGDHTYVGTHDGRPYVGPFSGNIIELCPVGALTSTAYRFRARPWDIEGAGSVCTLCPGQCNVEYTVRDDSKVLRVLDRQNDEVDDGWLCDKGRFGYEAVHAPERLRAPMVRDGGSLREVSWERALDEAAKALTKAGDVGRRAGRRAQHHQRGGLRPAAPVPRGAGLTAPGLARRRLAGSGAGARAGAARPVRARQRHRPRRRGAGGGVRAGGRDGRAGSARAQGRAAQRRQAGHADQPPRHAGGQRHRRALRAGRHRRRPDRTGSRAGLAARRRLAAGVARRGRAGRHRRRRRSCSRTPATW